MVDLTRRSFMLASIAASTCEAAGPLIDLESKGKQSLIHLDGNAPLIARLDGANLIQEKPGFSDPELTSNPNLFYTDLKANVLRRFTRDFQIKFINNNTNEKLELRLIRNRDLSILDLNNINHLCRDWRQNIVKELDPNLLKIFFDACACVAEDTGSVQVAIASGYRSRKTNEHLRRFSQRVAKNSLHIHGKALDFYFPHITHIDTLNILEKVATGGLGIYPNFFHIDSGANRRWSA